MKITLERFLIILQLVLLIGKITGWIPISWAWILVPLWLPMSVIMTIYIYDEIKDYRSKKRL